MSALAEAPTLFDDLGGEPADGRPTLADVLAGRWEALTAHKAVPCLVCGEPMTPEYGVHALPIGGRCRSCGTTLH